MAKVIMAILMGTSQQRQSTRPVYFPTLGGSRIAHYTTNNSLLVMSKNHVGADIKNTHKRIHVHILSYNPDFGRYYAWVLHKAKIAIINAFFGQFLT